MGVSMRWIVVIMAFLTFNQFVSAQLVTEPPADLFPDTNVIDDVLPIVTETTDTFEGEELSLDEKTAAIQAAVNQLQSSNSFNFLGEVLKFMESIFSIGVASPKFLLFAYGGLTAVIYFVGQVTPLAQKLPNILMIFISFILAAMVINFAIIEYGSGVILYFENIGGA